MGGHFWATLYILEYLPNKQPLVHRQTDRQTDRQTHINNVQYSRNHSTFQQQIRCQRAILSNDNVIIIIKRQHILYDNEAWSHIVNCNTTGTTWVKKTVPLQWALSRAAQCIVIGPVCLCVGFCGLWVCYHDNSKLRASILTKLGL